MPLDIPIDIDEIKDPADMMFTTPDFLKKALREKLQAIDAVIQKHVKIIVAERDKEYKYKQLLTSVFQLERSMVDFINWEPDPKKKPQPLKED